MTMLVLIGKLSNFTYNTKRQELWLWTICSAKLWDKVVGHDRIRNPCLRWVAEKLSVNTAQNGK